MAILSVRITMDTKIKIPDDIIDTVLHKYGEWNRIPVHFLRRRIPLNRLDELVEDADVEILDVSDEEEPI